MFTPKTLEFLSENRLRNSREWFAEHRREYEKYVLAPLVELASALGPAISGIDGLIITEPRVDRTISRIYCDMRYSKDRLLYREQMWISFRRDKYEYPRYPEFFFVMSPDGFFFGCGYYSASAAAMESIRGLILDSDPVFQRAKEAFETQDVFRMEGDMYRRTKYPERDEGLRNWLDRKSICFEHTAADVSELFSEKLAGEIRDAFVKMKPVYEFFIYAQNRARA